VKAIHAYYERQVMEPAVKGFLSLLEKQFPRNSLYLFELLQNAVDDGATTVTFASAPDPSVSGSSSQQAHTSLVVSHNGRKFTAMDTLGLSSVGLSTKGGAGNSKRTVGFMGIGFKAVYKRFGRVTISDGTWHFEFLEGGGGSNGGGGGSGWVLLPRWVESETRAAGGGGDGLATEAANAAGGCAFVLRKPRGGANAIMNDLRRLPPTVPPLLGRSALARQRDAGIEETLLEFALTWGDKRLRVTSPGATTPSTSSRGAPPPTGVCVEETRLENGQPAGAPRKQEWAFVCHTFVPNSEARAAFAAHTRKDSNNEEETSLFFPLGADGFPQPAPPGKPQQPGLLHAVLPTKLALPGPNGPASASSSASVTGTAGAATGAHWQGPWLLSVDRQDVQSLEDNAWNAALAQTLPELFVSLLRWIAKTGGGSGAAAGGLRSAESMASALAASYALVPLAQLRRSSAAPPPAKVVSNDGGGGGGGGGQKQDHRGQHKGGRSKGGGQGGRQQQQQQQQQKQQQQQQQQRQKVLELEVLGLTLPMSRLEAAISDENIVPVLSSIEQSTATTTMATASGTAATAVATTTTQTCVTFVRASRAGRLPEPYTRCIPVSVMQGWLGGRQPLATHLLGAAGASALWRRVQPPGAGGLTALSNAAKAYAREDEGVLAVLAAKLLAAHTACERERQALATVSGGASGGGKSSGGGGGGCGGGGGGSTAAAGDDDAGDKPPEPAFLSAGGAFVSQSQLVVPGEGFDRLPPAVRRLLSPALAGAARNVRGAGGAAALHPDLLALLHDAGSSSGGGGGGGGRNNKKFQNPRGGGGRGGSHFNDRAGAGYSATAVDGDDATQSIGAGAIASQTTPSERSAAVAALRAAVTGAATNVTVVPLSELALRFFSSGATDVNTPDGIEAVRALTKWAVEARKPELITHVLARSASTSSKQTLVLAPCGSVFLPSDVVAAAALPGAATAALDAYALQPHLTPALRNALAVAGAATGLTLTPAAGKPRTLGGKAFPQLRKNAKTVVMPYGLPALSWRPGAAEVDARLSPPFEALLKELLTFSGRTTSATETSSSEARGAALFALLAAASIDTSEAPSTTSPVAAYARSIDGAVPTEGTSEVGLYKLNPVDP
jgi:hypothetical protein